MAWERRDMEEFYRSEERAKGVRREFLRGCRHNDSKRLVGKLLVCKCGKKFIYRLKD
jgi:hypothetical protein